MNDASSSITFSVVASKGYIGHTAGLLMNLREFYPRAEIIVCALDEATRTAFGDTGDAGLACPHASEIWGVENWRNITSRMSVPERAFASKSALVSWAVETRDKPTLLLDSDLLFLGPIDDIVEKLTGQGLLLVPGRHPWRDWKKTAQFGLFSAGVIGVGPGALPMARAWRAMCFDTCIASPFSGTYYEQKYLDYFVSEPSLEILNDSGINVSQTLLKLLAPRKDADGAWRVADGTALRIYHSSRSTNEEMELARLKSDYNRRGLAAFGLEQSAGAPREAKLGNKIGLAALIRLLRIGGALERVARLLDSSTRRLIMIHRVVTLHDHSLGTRMAEVRRRHKLHAELETQAFPNTDNDPEIP
jgi:hypothetical protein